VAYEDRQNYLLEADVGVSLHFEHLETAYSFRTRMLDYLWAGLPVVATAGDGFADIITAEGIGTVVRGGDVDAVARALTDLLGNERARDACRERAAAVAQRFRWSVLLEPLVAFCADPRRAPDRPGWPGAGESSPGPAAPSDVRGPGALLRRGARLYRQGGLRAVARGAGHLPRRALHQVFRPR